MKIAERDDKSVRQRIDAPGSISGVSVSATISGMPPTLVATSGSAAAAASSTT
jgi:hypothetical protein